MQATDPVFYGGTINGILTLNGLIACAPSTGRKIDIYNDGATIYGFGLNDFESCIFGGADSALTYRVAEPGLIDLAGRVVFRADTAGITAPALALTGSLTAKFVLAAPNAANGAPTWRQLLSTDISGLGTFATANAAIPPAIGTTTPAAGAFTTLSASGAVSGSGFTALFAAPPAIGGTTANTGRFSTLTTTGQVLRPFAGNLTASATNTQAGALGLAALLNVVTTAAANTAVRLPNAAPAAGTFAEIIVRNQGANAVNCFPPTSGVINALAANAAISIPAGTVMHFGQTSATQYYVI